jgi:hypothetical protein
VATRSAQALQLAAFNSVDDPLVGLKSAQAQYLRCYLADQGAKRVLVEPAYFDRDYLSEFAAFYCTSTAGYENICRRLHYFAADIDRAALEAAAGGKADDLQSSYLGFVVLRPIPQTPIGRTVLRWYPENAPALPRIVEPSRKYRCNVAGIALDVTGLAWQQQDAGVGACATVALWSMLHSSAFDDRHVVPTTAEVTRTAHGPGMSAYRAFPSKGLNFGQLIATLRDSGFAPLVVPGDLDVSGDERFTREHFSSSMAAFVRSGYPVLVAGTMVQPKGNGVFEEIGGHAVCAAGFRQASSNPPKPGLLEFEDGATQFVYLHDDNLGPSVRFRIETDSSQSVVLRADAPASRNALGLKDPTVTHPQLRPSVLLAAAHDDVRLSPDTLHRQAREWGALLIAQTGGALGLTASARFTRLARYVKDELESVLGSNPAVLARTRLALWETVPPMSLNLGLVRFGRGPVPLLDVLFDTTDSEPNMRAFCHVAYDSALPPLIAHAWPAIGEDPGISIAAF